MAEEYDVRIKLISNKQPCHCGQQIGDEWEFGEKTPGNMCFAAYNSIFPFALVLKYGGRFPWQEDPDAVTASCPDPDVVNVFEIRRFPRKAK